MGGDASLSVTGVDVHEETYLDSLVLMAATVRMDRLDGVEWAGAVMASPSGLADLAAAGFTGPELDGLGANDFVLAVRAVDEDVLAAALAAGREAAFAEQVEASGPASGRVAAPPRNVREAVGRLDGANVAVVSVPGPFAALEAHHALSAGLHVLLFSDGVPLDEEIELKQRGAERGLLVMGPGAGTAVLGGTGLEFANVLRTSDDGSSRGAVGVVAAAGTGAQEVSALLSRWGVPVSHVIGVGGRDRSEAV